MVGDTLFDLDCARNAGVKSALVSWAVAVEEEDIHDGNRPDYFIEDPDEILNLLK